MNDSAIAKESISDRVCQVIIGRILDGTYPPGLRLVELQLAREFNTSQAPVREAFCKMEAAGLVETEPYRGTRVRRVSEDEMGQASQVRGVLEQLAAELSAANLQRNLKALRAEAEAVSAAAKAGNPEVYVTRNHLFHRLDRRGCRQCGSAADLGFVGLRRRQPRAYRSWLGRPGGRGQGT